MIRRSLCQWGREVDKKRKRGLQSMNLYNVQETEVESNERDVLTWREDRWIGWEVDREPVLPVYKRTQSGPAAEHYGLLSATSEPATYLKQNQFIKRWHYFFLQVPDRRAAYSRSFRFHVTRNPVTQSNKIQCCWKGLKQGPEQGGLSR